MSRPRAAGSRPARTAVRRSIDVLALVVVIVTVASIEQLPSWLPFLLILTAGALAYFGRRITVTSRRRELITLAHLAKEAHRGHH